MNGPKVIAEFAGNGRTAKKFIDEEINHEKHRKWSHSFSLHLCTEFFNLVLLRSGLSDQQHE